MAMNLVQLHKTKHPDPAARARYDRLIGIDAQKAEFLEYLLRVLDPRRLSRWLKKHHPKGLPLAKRIEDRPPLVVLGGETGCGKTAVATSIGTVVAEALDEQVVVLETTSVAVASSVNSLSVSRQLSRRPVSRSDNILAS
jgi:hypothetical protein